MKNADRTMVYDSSLQMEACHFTGFARPFPNHFHGYYVIGLVEQGQRSLRCKNRKYTLQKGDIVLFCPGDSHACTQIGSGTLEYYGLNIPRTTMLEQTEKITGKRELPRFSRTVIRDGELACTLRGLHEQIKSGEGVIKKEQSLSCLLSQLLWKYREPSAGTRPLCTAEIEAICAFMEEHYETRISLAQLCERTGCSKSTLLRAFTKAKGITPYRFLKNIRIGKAQELLGRGIPAVEVALRTGFSDQSHFTNSFHQLTGLSPGVYREGFGKKRETEKKTYEA